jgi:hypothetical protein
LAADAIWSWSHSLKLCEGLLHLRDHSPLVSQVRSQFGDAALNRSEASRLIDKRSRGRAAGRYVSLNLRLGFLNLPVLSLGLGQQVESGGRLSHSAGWHV